ncbi:hypothetical protein Tco_0790836 [Tanacetum coccineum]
MSNTNNNLQTQTSNALHNAIMKAGGKYHPPMLASGSYAQWKSIIKRYINTKPNNELIHYCLHNPPYKFKWTEKIVPVDEGIDNDIYSTVDACPNSCEMWKAIERLKQCKSINVQDLESNLYWEFGKFTLRDGESLESYYLRFYKIMNELVKNQCDVTNHQVNVQFLLQLQPEWQRFVTLVKKSQELKTISDHKLYDIPKQHQNEVNEIRAERLAHIANLLALQATRNRGKAIVNSSVPIYDQEPATVTEDDEMSKEKEIDKLMALISLSFKKIYKPTNNNLRTSSNTSRANQDNSPRINRGTGYENQRVVNVAGTSENKDDTDDESDDPELEAHYMYMEQIQEVTPDFADISGPIFDIEPLQKVQNNHDNYNVFTIENEHPEQPESVTDAYLEEQEKEAQIKFYKTREDKELDKVIALENKVKVLDDIVYKTGQSIQTMNMLNRNCKTSFAKLEFLKKAQRANPRLYDIGVILTTSVSRPQLKNNQMGDSVMPNNSQGKKQEVEEYGRNFNFSNNKTSVTACNDNLNC